MSLNLYAYSKISHTTQVQFLHPLVAFSILSYVLIFAFRYNVGVDYPAYYSDYITAKKYTNFNSLHYEPFFSWFTWFLSKNNVHFTVYFGLIAFVQIFFLCKAFEKKKYLLPYVIISFFLSFAFISWQNVLRQNIVVAIFLYIVLRRRNLNFVAYIFIVFFCFFIHRSSVVLLFIYPFIKKNLIEIKKTFIGISLLCCCVFVGIKFDLFSQVMGNPAFGSLMVGLDYGSYVLNEEYGAQGMGKSMGIGFLLRLVNEIIIVGMSSRMRCFYNDDKDFRICYNLYFLGLCLLYIFPLSMVLQRPNLYLRSFSIPIYAYYIYYLFHVKANASFGIRGLGVIFIFIFILLFLYQIYNPIGNLVEYHFFWESFSVKNSF
ncbi:MAG: EpsG family protein [Bacteroides sp.]|nr:EpsG family protein [Bacteroides sp.]MCI1683834.1 EpsG family protein [Bacteroides sp.]